MWLQWLPWRAVWWSSHNRGGARGDLATTDPHRGPVALGTPLLAWAPRSSPRCRLPSQLPHLYPCRLVAFQYWQFLVALVFGGLCDVSFYLTDFIHPGHYLWQWAVMLIGVILVSFGMFLQILPRILFSPGEGIVAAITLASGWRIGTVKQFFDRSLTLIAVAIGRIFVGELSCSRWFGQGLPAPL